MLDEAFHWAKVQFGTADLGDARRTDHLVSTMAALAQAPNESLPRQLGSIAGVKAAYRLFDCAAVTREAVMDPHVAQCRADAARHPVVLMVHDDTTLDFSSHRQLHGAGRIGDDRGTGFLAHSCLAVLPSGLMVGLAHQTIWARPPKGVARQARESAVWADPKGSGAKPSRRSAAPRQRPVSFRSGTAALTFSSIWSVSSKPGGMRLCARRRTDAGPRVADR